MFSLYQADVRFVEFAKGETWSPKVQIDYFAHTDILIAHHGAAVSLSSVMQPGSLVIEIFNYRCKCTYFDSLYHGCGLLSEKVFNEWGAEYGMEQCSGNNRKDSSDDAAVNVHRVSEILISYFRRKYGRK